MGTRAKGFFEREFGPLTFSKLARAARTSLDLTQTEMGKRLGISKSVVCDIEKGRREVSLRMAMKIADAGRISRKLAVKLCLQDKLNREKIKMTVDIAA